MSRGGQFQEEMDIRFEFIEGVPDRDILDIQQIWRVDQVAYGSILNDWRFEPRQFVYDPEVSAYVIKTAISGHGQEGEFIPRNHTIDVDGFIDSWAVWKECAENPVYPQGGTWVYDRAGWCPGMATDVRKFDVTPYFQFSQTPFVDYSVQTASGDSRYIVNSQLVKYGAPNKQIDLGILDVLHPSPKIEYARSNPSCHNPAVIIKNHGAETIKSATIKYGIVGKTENSYQWTGSLPFLIEQKINLPFNQTLSVAEEGDQFFVKIQPDGQSDENPNNDEYISDIQITDHFDDELIIEWRTNLTPFETSYRVEDKDGNVILTKSGSALNNNTIYRDTLRNLVGCYKLYISDNDNDGISWWANNDGNGYIRVKENGGPWKTIATDFGAFVEYNFTAGMLSSNEELAFDRSVLIYPNPSSGDMYLSKLESWENKIKVQLTDQIGRVVYKDIKFKNEISERPLAFLNNLEKGMYMLNLSDESKQTTIKLVRN
jgi:hypothetical protein